MGSRRESAGPERRWADLTHVLFVADRTRVSSSPGPAEIFRKVPANRGQPLDPEVVAKARHH